MPKILAWNMERINVWRALTVSWTYCIPGFSCHPRSSSLRYVTMSWWPVRELRTGYPLGAFSVLQKIHCSVGNIYSSLLPRPDFNCEDILLCGYTYSMESLTSIFTGLTTDLSATLSPGQSYEILCLLCFSSVHEQFHRSKWLFSIPFQYHHLLTNACVL